jgi:hypothetical protein
MFWPPLIVMETRRENEALLIVEPAGMLLTSNCMRALRGHPLED